MHSDFPKGPYGRPDFTNSLDHRNLFYTKSRAAPVPGRPQTLGRRRSCSNRDMDGHDDEIVFIELCKRSAKEGRQPTVMRGGKISKWGSHEPEERGERDGSRAPGGQSEGTEERQAGAKEAICEAQACPSMP